MAAPCRATAISPTGGSHRSVMLCPTTRSRAPPQDPKCGGDRLPDDRYPARVSQTLQARLEGLPKTVRAIAWKAQIRLCARYRRLTAAGKKRPLVIAAIARAMPAFLWAIAQHVAPAA